MIIELLNVTLFGIDAHNPAGLLRAAEICQRKIKFGAVKIITERLFPGATSDEGRRHYSKFMIKKLTEHFTTSHVLIIHPDGYIQNPSSWDNEWLQYDYIGAPWFFYNKWQVGNGGFSLRSKKLCDILATDNDLKEVILEDDPLYRQYNLYLEDNIICRQYRPYLEEVHGIKFAPLEVAKKFSVEAYGLHPEKQIYNGEFGFHGYLVKKLPIPIR